jgi:hypothetical protein
MGETVRHRPKGIYRKRLTMHESLRRQIDKRRLLHEEDLAAGLGRVFLPGAIARKYPNASREFACNTFSHRRAFPSIPAGIKNRSTERGIMLEKVFSNVR